MWTLELTDHERDTLAEVLQSFLSDLRTEVAHTDRLAYRKRLKAQEHAVKDLLARVEREHASAA